MAFWREAYGTVSHGRNWSDPAPLPIVRVGGLQSATVCGVCCEV